MNEKHCNQCPNQCPADALKCGRGRRYFGLESGDEGERRPRHDHEEPSGLIGLLRQCGHLLHHGGGDGDNLLSALNEQEQKELERLLEKLLSDWKSRVPAGGLEHRHGHHR